MKRLILLFFLTLSALVFGVRTLSFEEAKTLYPEMEMEPFSILCYGTRYTVEKEWQEAPRIFFAWDSQTGYETLVESVFKEAGYVIAPQGDLFVGKIQTLRDDFLYWDFSFQGKRTTNRDAVVRKNETLRESLLGFLTLHYGITEKEEGKGGATFPYLVLFKNRHPYMLADRFLEPTGVLLLEGQGFSIWKFADRNVRLKATSSQKATEASVLQVTIDRVPVQAIDLEDASFTYSLETHPAGVLVRVDGLEYETPFSILLPQGVHRLEVAGEERFFYLSETTHQFLEIDEPSGILSIELDLPANIALYREEETVFATQSATRITQTLPLGPYILRIQREAFEPIEETVEVLPGKRVEKTFMMTPIPGAVFLRQQLDQPCQDIYINQGWVILVESEKSVFMPLPANQGEPFYLEDRIVGAMGRFSHSYRTVYLDDRPFFQASFPIAHVELLEDEIWIFDAAGTLTAMNALTNKTLWQRAVGYIPYWTYRYNRWLALLDIYGNFLLLEPQRGYYEVLQYRFGVLKEIDHMTATPNLLRVYFSPDSTLSYSFETRSCHYEDDTAFESDRIVLTKTGFQRGSDIFYRLEEPLRAFDIDDGRIAVLYDQFYAVLFAPGD